MQLIATPVSTRSGIALPSRTGRVAVRRAPLCTAQKYDGPKTMPKVAAAPLAAALAAALLLGTAAPEEALAARSGGRVGGSVSRSAPAPSRQKTTIVNNTTVVAAPPVFSPFGGFGYGMPSFFFFPMGFGMGGGFFSLLVGLMLVSVLVNVVSSFANKNKNDIY